LKVEELKALADEGYYDAVEIKECIDNGITPYILEPVSTVPKNVNILEAGYYKVVLPSCLRCTIVQIVHKY